MSIKQGSGCDCSWEPQGTTSNQATDTPDLERGAIQELKTILFKNQVLDRGRCVLLLVKFTMLELIFKGPHLSSQQGLLALELSVDFSQWSTSYPQAATQVTEWPHFRAPSFLKYDVAQRKKKTKQTYLLHDSASPLPAPSSWLFFPPSGHYFFLVVWHLPCTLPTLLKQSLKRLLISHFLVSGDHLHSGLPLLWSLWSWALPSREEKFF